MVSKFLKTCIGCVSSSGASWSEAYFDGSSVGRSPIELFHLYSPELKKGFFGPPLAGDLSKKTPDPDSFKAKSSNQSPLGCLKGLFLNALDGTCGCRCNQRVPWICGKVNMPHAACADRFSCQSNNIRWIALLMDSKDVIFQMAAA